MAVNLLHTLNRKHLQEIAYLWLFTININIIASSHKENEKKAQNPKNKESTIKEPSKPPNLNPNPNPNSCHSPSPIYQIPKVNPTRFGLSGCYSIHQKLGIVIAHQIITLLHLIYLYVQGRITHSTAL